MTQLIPLLMMYMMKYLGISEVEIKKGNQAGINAAMFDHNDCVFALSDIKSVKRMSLKFIKLLSFKK